jgi:hypothetical protein
VAAQNGPLLIPDHHERDLSAFQVLMNIDGGGGVLRRWRIQAASSKFNHGDHLFVGQMKPIHDLVD